MNDHAAMEAINEVLEQFYRGNLSADEALTKVAYITGQNSISHQEARP